MLTNIKIKHFHNIPLSILDLAPITEDGDASQSFANSVELAQYAEKWGFHRYWFAEHHNMPGIASSATSVVIGHIAGATKQIRVGSGGIMLPNHAPLVIAEQFGTLESMFPGRIDLGLGRAPGSDQATAYALRRTLSSRAEDFPAQLEELQSFFQHDPTARVRAFPGEGQDIPIWLLGSSGFSAQLAAQKGLPFSFASHFSPDYTLQALELYRDNFKPSEVLKKPHSMVGINIIAADSDERAKWLATSQQQQFLSLTRGNPTPLKPPVDNIDDIWTSHERAAIGKTLDPRSTIVGDPDKVKQSLENFLNETKADEVIINSQIYYQKDRLRSYEIISELMD
ncbi:LLM class flavin-dependent oxidoreductase [Aquibacillus sp. 3ASR75-11]|uniref:LLM class flavin-dependent oxidoreductase n=1 Tax=Terrihalobacillus insolitus TaxID=2950438 RepID=A0A9X4ANG0_9BACI|nr:LLM class flavin-dependent oxidoreductase [Terrihalobacillus insolitus]MDC3414413.1 LLM class flavin-dependent oxidoreductase [Terrihalobacillus insolitus]MDC3424495.1 LLM class flavin-dependent oxidoreductase [Terrihalobacillus insolitus]